MKKTSLLLISFLWSLKMLGQISVELLSYANMPACDGVIEVFAQGTAGPFTVEVVQYEEVVKLKTPIPNGENSLIIEGLCDGKHYVNVTNNFGCVTPIVIFVTRCEFIINDEEPSKGFPTTCGAKDGFIRFFSFPLVGGIGNLTYTWTNREGEIIPYHQNDGLHIKNVGSSIYTLTVEDEKGCEVTADYDLLSENEPSAYGEPTASCEGEDNGRVNLVATMPPANNPGRVNFEWSTGVVIENEIVGTIENLSPGTYTVTISDLQGLCAIERSYTVEERASTGPFTFTSSIELSCGSDNNGSINLAATGGNPPYKYRWDEFAVFGASRSNLAGDTYCVTITDDCDREIRECFDIALPAPEIDIVPIINCDAYWPRGQLLAIRNGGIGPFTYNWSNGIQEPVNDNLNKGVYTLTVTDGNNCEYIESYDLILPEVYVYDDHNPCEGFFDGEITIKVINPFNEEASITFANGLQYQFAEGEEMHTFSGLEGDISYDYIGVVGDCIIEREYSLDEKETEKIFNGDITAAAETGICTFDEECDGELAREDSYFSEIDYQLFGAQGGYLGGCSIPGFCGDTEVITKDYDKKVVRAFEYEQVLRVAINSSGWPSDIVWGHILYFQGQNLENCDWVKYCPATLRLLEKWDLPFNRNGNVEWTAEGCVELTCAGIFKTEFCPNENVPDYFSTFEGELPAPPVIPDGCSPRRLRVVQLTAWDPQLEQEFGLEYLSSSLKEFVDEIDIDDIASGKINCAQVLFCRNNFEFISSNLSSEFVNCTAYVNPHNGELITPCIVEETGENWFNVTCFDESCFCFNDGISINFQYPDDDFFSIPEDHQIKVIEGTTTRSSSFVNLGMGIAEGRILGKGIFKDDENGIYNDFTFRSTITSRIATRNIIEYIIEWDNNEVVYIEEHQANKYQLWREAGGSSWAEVLTSDKMEISHLSKEKDIIYLGGTFQGSLTFGEEKITNDTEYAGFLLEINKEGEIVNRQIVENINPAADFLIEDGPQGILLSGEPNESTINVNGQFQEMQDGGVFNVKVSSESVTTNTEIKTQGNIKTKKVIQAFENGKRTYLFKGEGNIEVGGFNYTTIDRDIALIKVNNNGTKRWFKRFRSINGGAVKSIDIVSGENQMVYVGLTFTGGLAFKRDRFYSKGGEDILIFKLDKNGNLIDYKQYGTVEDERVMELLYDSGVLYFGGEFAGQESDRLIGNLKYVNHSQTYNNAYVSYLFDADFEKAALHSEDTDLTDELKKAMVAMPNPFSDQITIEANDLSITQLAIYNTLGEQVAINKLTAGRVWKVDFSGIPKGLYIVQATNEKGQTIAVESIVHQ